MYTAFMKNRATAWNYAKGLRHLLPKNFDWRDAGVDIDGKDDLTELATQMLSREAFSNNSSAI